MAITHLAKEKEVTVLDTSSLLAHNTYIRSKEQQMDKVDKVDAILARMKEAYVEEGIDGDFADARRYYLNDASEEEVDYDYAKWCHA